MPTKHPRIAVTCDRELSEALARVEAIVGAPEHRARLVRALALRGAAAVIDEASDRTDALERLAVLSTTPGRLFDRDVLSRIDEEAWRHDPEPA